MNYSKPLVLKPPVNYCKQVLPTGSTAITPTKKCRYRCHGGPSHRGYLTLANPNTAVFAMGTYNGYYTLVGKGTLKWVDVKRKEVN